MSVRDASSVQTAAPVSPAPPALATGAGLELTAVSWNLHKGRSPLGFTAWHAMRDWLRSTPADVYFLQEALARRVSRPTSVFGAPLGDPADDVWDCHAADRKSVV